MKTITLRGCSQEVMRGIESLARERHASMNKTVLDILESSFGLKKHRPQKRCHDLDKFFGTWTKIEADSFDKGLHEQRKIDRGAWK